MSTHTPPWSASDLSLERGAGAKRDDRHAVRGGGAHDGADLVGRLRVGDDVGSGWLWYDSPWLW